MSVFLEDITRAVLMVRIGSVGKWSDRMSCYLQFDRTLYSKERTFCTFIPPILRGRVPAEINELLRCKLC